MRIAFTHNLQATDDEAEAEFDREETVAAIADGLRRLGHEVARVDVRGSPSALVRRLEDFRPDLVFNTAEGTHGRFREAFYPALFDQLGLPFTGSDAYACAVTLDKQLSKMVVAQAGVPTPKWVFVDAQQAAGGLDVDAWGLTFPVIVKPNFEGSSKGITVDSIVDEPGQLRARVLAALERYPSGLLVEEFITGRDVVVPFLQAASAGTGGVLAPVGYRFDESIIGKRKHVIYDYELKCVSSDAVTVECPADIPAAARARLEALSARVFQALDVRDLGRIDWRLAPDGRVAFLEVNALPSLEPGAGIYLAAAEAGLSRVEDVLGAVIESAARRYGLSAGPSVFVRHALKVGLTYNLKRIVAGSEHDDDSEAEYDSQKTIDALADAIKSHGHQVVLLEANTDVIRRLPDAGVDCVFNLSEGVRGRAREACVPAMLELLDIPYSGSDATTMALALDKALCKAVVKDAGVPVARSVVLHTGDEALQGLRFPAIAKPNFEGSSKGIVGRSVVESEAELRFVAREMAQKYRQEVLVEEFLPGREFTVALLARGDGDGKSDVEVLPPMEIVYLDEHERFPIYSFARKLDWSEKIRYDRPARLEGALRDEVHDVALRAWRALGCKDVARMDLRCDVDGRVSFIECNPLPGITPGWSDLCLICETAGVSYAQLIGRILASAVSRGHNRRAAAPSQHRHR